MRRTSALLRRRIVGTPPSDQVGDSGSELIVTGLSMHHIYCDRKIEAIDSYASGLNLTGLYKLGKPGRVVVEGRRTNVEQYVSVVRRWRWQKIAVMGTYAVDERRFAAFTEAMTSAEFEQLMLTAELKSLHDDMVRSYKAPRPILK